MKASLHEKGSSDRKLMEEVQEPSWCPFCQISLKGLSAFASVFLGPIYDGGYLVCKHIFTLSFPRLKEVPFIKEAWDLCKER